MKREFRKHMHLLHTSLLQTTESNPNKDSITRFFFQICVLIESHQVKRKDAWQNAGFSSNKTTHYKIKDAGMLFIRKTELEKGYREHNLTINFLFTIYMKKQKWNKQLLLILQKIRNVPFLSWEL